MDTNAKIIMELNNENLRRPRLSRMGNHTTSEVLHEEEETSFHIDKNSYEIHSIETDSHSKDTLERPVILFDRWKVLQTDLNNKQNKSKTSENENLTSETAENHNYTNTHPDNRKLSSPDSLNDINSLTQKNCSSNSSDSKRSIVKKPRPNSLAIVSLSCDSVNFPTCSHSRSNQEVSQFAAGSASTNLIDTRAVSVDTLLEPRPGLHQRRNKRPTSLQIPSLTNISIAPPPPVRTAHLLQSQNFTFNSHPPAARQRSYSMPSSALVDIRKEVQSPKHSLDEALVLLNKKKISKNDIDEQSLLHRAADAGHVKVIKRCIQAGCSINRKLSNLNGISALHCAVRADKNAEQATRLLLQYGIEVNAANDLGETAIFSAIIHKHMRCVELLIEHRCDINKVWQQSTPLYLLVVNKEIETTKKLIIDGANITKLPAYIHQPFHALLDQCHSQPITQRHIEVMQLLVQADGNIVKHLLNYCGTTPGCSEQDLIYHIYRMEVGPTQNQGKQIIKNLIKLGYMPSRGELSTMSQSDGDYDYMYSYVKSGPAPLKDLCIRKIREKLRRNVLYALQRWSIPERERAQLLLLPDPLPDHEYENIEVTRRDKGGIKSRRKSLRSLVSGITIRLSKRFKKQDLETAMKNSTPSNNNSRNSSPQLAVLRNHKEKAMSMPSGIAMKPSPKPKPKPNPRPKYLKRNSRKSSDLKEVKEIIKQYSNSETSLASSSSKEALNVSTERIAMENKSYVKDTEEDEEATVKFLSNKIQIEDENISQSSEEVTVRFNEPATIHAVDNRAHKFTGPQLTPMKDHAPLIGTGSLSLQSSASVDDC